jgi:hypothetical protein
MDCVEILISAASTKPFSEFKSIVELYTKRNQMNICHQDKQTGNFLTHLVVLFNPHKYERIQMLEFLKNKKLSFDCVNNDGDTIAHLMAKRSDYLIMNYLLNSPQTDVQMFWGIYNNEHKLPLDYFIEKIFYIQDNFTDTLEEANELKSQLFSLETITKYTDEIKTNQGLKGYDPKYENMDRLFKNAYLFEQKRCVPYLKNSEDLDYFTSDIDLFYEEESINKLFDFEGKECYNNFEPEYFADVFDALFVNFEPGEYDQLSFLKTISSRILRYADIYIRLTDEVVRLTDTDTDADFDPLLELPENRRNQIIIRTFPDQSLLVEYMDDIEMMQKIHRVYRTLVEYSEQVQSYIDTNILYKRNYNSKLNTKLNEKDVWNRLENTERPLLDLMCAIHPGHRDVLEKIYTNDFVMEIDIEPNIKEFILYLSCYKYLESESNTQIICDNVYRKIPHKNQKIRLDNFEKTQRILKATEPYISDTQILVSNGVLDMLRFEKEHPKNIDHCLWSDVNNLNRFIKKINSEDFDEICSSVLKKCIGVSGENMYTIEALRLNCLLNLQQSKHYLFLIGMTEMKSIKLSLFTADDLSKCFNIDMMIKDKKFKVDFTKEPPGKSEIDFSLISNEIENKIKSVLERLVIQNHM